MLCCHHRCYFRYVVAKGKTAAWLGARFFGFRENRQLFALICLDEPEKFYKCFPGWVQPLPGNCRMTAVTTLKPTPRVKGFHCVQRSFTATWQTNRAANPPVPRSSFGGAFPMCLTSGRGDRRRFNPLPETAPNKGQAHYRRLVHGREAGQAIAQVL